MKAERFLLLNALKKILRNSRGRQLSKDVAIIINNSIKAEKAETLELIAKLTANHIAEVHQRSIFNPKFYDQGLRQLESKNGKAKVENDQSGWTAGVLAVIFLKSEQLGEEGEGATQAICNFIRSYDIDSYNILTGKKRL
ncbi:MAG: hypothetical protein CMF70_10665 [Magnetovibrio sp.]|nr:hypothetical protein [Magnetovibrio sp.]